MSEIRELQEKSCKPCEGGVKSFSSQEAERYLRHLPEWLPNEDNTAIWKDFFMKDFRAALALIQKIGELAEKEAHHPDLHLTNYRKLRIELSTHAIGGLSENDFIFASKVELLPKDLKVKK